MNNTTKVRLRTDTAQNPAVHFAACPCCPDPEHMPPPCLRLHGDDQRVIHPMSSSLPSVRLPLALNVQFGGVGPPVLLFRGGVHTADQLTLGNPSTPLPPPPPPPMVKRNPSKQSRKKHHHHKEHSEGAYLVVYHPLNKLGYIELVRWHSPRSTHAAANVAV